GTPRQSLYRQAASRSNARSRTFPSRIPLRQHPRNRQLVAQPLHESALLQALERVQNQRGLARAVDSAGDVPALLGNGSRRTSSPDQAVEDLLLVGREMGGHGASSASAMNRQNKTHSSKLRLSSHSLRASTRHAHASYAASRFVVFHFAFSGKAASSRSFSLMVFIRSFLAVGRA